MRRRCLKDTPGTGNAGFFRKMKPCLFVACLVERARKKLFPESKREDDIGLFEMTAGVGGKSTFTLVVALEVRGRFLVAYDIGLGMIDVYRSASLMNSPSLTGDLD